MTTLPLRKRRLLEKVPSWCQPFLGLGIGRMETDQLTITHGNTPGEADLLKEGFKST